MGKTAEFVDLIQRCKAAGFKVENEEDTVPGIFYDFGAEGFEPSEDCDHPPRIFFGLGVNGWCFGFSSGLGQETVWLTTNDPVEAIKWSELILSIEPNW